MKSVTGGNTLRELVAAQPSEVTLENAKWQLEDGEWLLVAVVSHYGRIVTIVLIETEDDIARMETAIRPMNERFEYGLLDRSFAEKFNSLSVS